MTESFTHSISNSLINEYTRLAFLEIFSTMLLIFHVTNEKEIHHACNFYVIKFMFSKKVTKVDEIFTADLILCSKCHMEGEDLSIFVALLENTNFKMKTSSLLNT